MADRKDIIKVTIVACNIHVSQGLPKVRNIFNNECICRQTNIGMADKIRFFVIWKI